MNDYGLREWINYFDKDELDMVMGYLHDYHTYPDSDLCPDYNNVLNAFKLCDPYNLKVVIIGEEPSTKKGQATGLAFASKRLDTMNSDLKMFDNSIFRYWDAGKDMDSSVLDKTLTHWASQGILLINSALTTEVENPRVHIDLWDQLMKMFIKRLSDISIGIVFVLLGDESKKFEDYIVSGRSHLILKDDLPSDYIARGIDRRYVFFKAIDLFLKDRFDEEIKWYEDAWEGFVRLSSGKNGIEKLWY